MAIYISRSIFEKKLALAQFGLELAGGRSFKGKALPILSEAGQNLIKNLTSINRAKKASQKEKTLAAFGVWKLPKVIRENILAYVEL